MFQKILEYAGPYKKTTFLASAVILLGVFMSVLPFIFACQIIAPLENPWTCPMRRSG